MAFPSGLQHTLTTLVKLRLTSSALPRLHLTNRNRATPGGEFIPPLQAPLTLRTKGLVQLASTKIGYFNIVG